MRILGPIDSHHLADACQRRGLRGHRGGVGAEQRDGDLGIRRSLSRSVTHLAVRGIERTCRRVHR